MSPTATVAGGGNAARRSGVRDRSGARQVTVLEHRAAGDRIEVVRT
jgi:hypothetical protein